MFVPGRRERVVHGLVVVLRAHGGWARSMKVGSTASLECVNVRKREREIRILREEVGDQSAWTNRARER